MELSTSSDHTTARLGIRIPPCERLPEVADAIEAAEAAGFDVAWIPDSHFLWRDVWAALALAATRTTRIRLGTCVTNFETRHVSVTASAAASIEELAPGRFILGIGTGDSAVKTIGRHPTRLAAMRERIMILRALLAGESVDFDGRRMRLGHRVGGTTVPIYLAANGPKALVLAGELCDGAIVLAGITPEHVQRVRSLVATGAMGAGRSVEDVDICMGVHCHVSNRGDAWRLVKPLVVGSAQTGGKDTLSAMGIECDPPPVVGGIYPDVGHAEDWDAATEACDEWVTDADAHRYARAFCAIGSVDACQGQLARAASAGVSSFYVRHLGSYTLPHELIAAFSPVLKLPARSGARA